MRYVSGSGTATLTFEYAVQPGDTDPDGVWVQTESGDRPQGWWSGPRQGDDPARHDRTPIATS